MSGDRVTRRDAMGLGAAAAGLFAWNGSGAAKVLAAGENQGGRRRVLRLAHLTDIHVQPELRANEGMIACLHHVQQLQDKPELIITGGDSIMDSLAADNARTQRQWDLWTGILQGECSIPVRSCIGNHDIWGWFKSRSGATGDEPSYGKKRAVEMLQLEERYYAFEQAGWKFIILDSTQPLADRAESYAAYCDDEQYDWLERTLRDTPAETSVLVTSHIPIFSVTALQHDPDEQGVTEFGAGLIHIDRLKLKQLFARHPNVKACLSGHTHLLDRVDYNGVTYLCDGAVSGGWWKGRHVDCDEGYAVIDLYDDGSLDREYVTYGWQAAGA